jgi:hypothetical protein
MTTTQNRITTTSREPAVRMTAKQRKAVVVALDHLVGREAA